MLPKTDICSQGNDVYSAMLKAGTAGKVKIHMVENYPPKDVGDNADGIILQNIGADLLFPFQPLS